MRRAPWAAAAAVLLALLLAPEAHAQASPPWSSSAFSDTLTDGAEFDSVPVVSGTFVYDCNPFCGPDPVIKKITVGLHFHSDFTPLDGCTEPQDQSTTYANNTTRTNSRVEQPFYFDSVTADCNGHYDVLAVADATGTADGTLVASDVVIAVVPDPPKSVKAERSGSDIAVSWVGPEAQAPDFEGYRVSRVDGAGKETVIVTGPTTSGNLTDKGVAAGTYTYVVYSMRAGADPSAGTSSSKVTVDAPPTSTTDSSGSTASDASDATGGDGGSTIVLGPKGGGVAGATIVHVPSSRSATSAGGSAGGSTTQNGSADGALADEGYSTELPYEAEPGELEAARPSVRNADDPPGAALLVPGAVASVLFTWSMLILFVTRQARWADAGLLPLLVEPDGHAVDSAPAPDPFFAVPVDARPVLRYRGGYDAYSFDDFDEL